jgi:hypothetical protein
VRPLSPSGERTLESGAVDLCFSAGRNVASSAWMSAVRLITHDSGLDSLRSSRPTSWGELELGPPVWTWEHDFTRAGEPVRQFETMLLGEGVLVGH